MAKVVVGAYESSTRLNKSKDGLNLQTVNCASLVQEQTV